MVSRKKMIHLLDTDGHQLADYAMDNKIHATAIVGMENVVF